MTQVLQPDSIADLCDAVREASSTIAVLGNGTRHHVQETGTLLSSRNITGVLRYDPSALTIVARSGTPIADIVEALAEKNQMLAFEPPDHRHITRRSGEPTLGGAISVNASGPRRFMAGSARDFVIGAKLVDGRGQVITSGGRVMKNVTGYDLARLFCGARGRLGVITEVALKVLPRPDAVATITFAETDPGKAISRMSPALRSPFEVSGAAWSEGRAFLRVEGFAASVRYRAGELVKILPASTLIDEDPWEALRDVRTLACSQASLWRIVLRPTQAARLATRLAQNGATMAIDWGGGLIWLTPPPEMDVTAECSGVDGYAECVRGIPSQQIATKTDTPSERLSVALYRAFDPRGLFQKKA